MNPSRLKIMQLIHAAFCVAICLFSAVVFSLVQGNLHLNAAFGQDDALFPLFPLLAILAVLTGTFLFRKQLSALEDTLSGEEKVIRYQTAFIIRSAFFEAATLMNIVAFLISANLVFFIVAATIFIAFLLTRPTRTGLAEALKLGYEDTEKL
ncbi:hypothetical protein [Pedobacter sp.]|jgi:hypothetical protein|uniref:hypothetical protein n=1 Tax=Pedobacter sp. TaxID=1411316 RepID=UPI002D00A210|nr:hypothetical protein [Pedobacter sp.]HWW39917.1 hypothetical protein [Pedobacter sp.]